MEEFMGKCEDCCSRSANASKRSTAFACGLSPARLVSGTEGENPANGSLGIEGLEDSKKSKPPDGGGLDASKLNDWAAFQTGG